MLMNEKDVNNLVIGGERFALINEKLIGRSFTVRGGKKVLFIGNEFSEKAKELDTGYVADNQTSTILHLLYVYTSNDNDYWVKTKLGVTVNSFSGRVPCYIRLSDIQLMS